LFSPDELPPYLGTWHPILPSPRLSAVLREKEEEAERKDRDRKFLQGSLWKVPLKNQRFTGAVRKVADQWNFFWHPQTCSFSQTPHNQDNKMVKKLCAVSQCSKIILILDFVCIGVAEAPTLSP
jgi:hypothetical protein